MKSTMTLKQDRFDIDHMAQDELARLCLLCELRDIEAAGDVKLLDLANLKPYTRKHGYDRVDVCLDYSPFSLSFYCKQIAEMRRLKHALPLTETARAAYDNAEYKTHVFTLIHEDERLAAIFYFLLRSHDDGMIKTRKELYALLHYALKSWLVEYTLDEVDVRLFADEYPQPNAIDDPLNHFPDGLDLSEEKRDNAADS